MHSFHSTRLAVIFDNFGPYHLARLHAAAGVCDLLAVEVSGRSAEYAWTKAATTTKFRRATLFEEKSAKATSGWEVWQNLERVLSQFQPQVVAVPGWSSSAAFGALRWCASAGVPALTMSESTSWDEKRVAWKEWIKRRLVRLGSSALVGGSPHRDYMVQLGMPQDRVFLGYDAVDNGYFAAGAAKVMNQKADIRKKYDLPENFFLASARFIEKKNLPRLIQAYARYRALSSNSRLLPPGSAPWSMVLLGDGPLKSDVCRLISGLALQDFVRLPGFKQYSELPAYYSLASAFIHPSTTEQWGLVVNEAMASGLPVLVSNRCGCAVDLVQEGRNGFTFDPCDAEALAQLMLRLTETPKHQLAEMGDASREVIANWGPERFGDGLARAVRTALATPLSHPGWVDQLLLRALLPR